MEEDIVITVDFEGGDGAQKNAGHIQVVPAAIQWEDFELMLKVYSDQTQIAVTYVDEGDEGVIVSCQEDIHEAFKVARKFNNTLHMNVVCSEPLQMDSISEEFKPETTSGKASSGDHAKIDGIAVYPTPLTHPTVKIDGIAVYPTPMDDDQENIFQKSGRKSKCFFLKNANVDLVLSSEFNSSSKVNVLSLQEKKVGPEFVNHQLFYEHPQSGTLRCVMNDLCLEANGDMAVLRPYQHEKTSQQWIVKNDKIENRFNPRWVISGGEDRRITATNFTGHLSQHWHTELLKSENEDESEKCDSGGATGGLRSNRPTKKSRLKDYYTQLAQNVGRLHSQGRLKGFKAGNMRPRQEGVAQATKEEASSGPELKTYMDDLKIELKEMCRQMCSDISHSVTRQVLVNLEGAVIASVPGRPLGGVPVPARGNGEAAPRYHHPGVICYICNVDIVGIRYKCGNCADFDLCDSCEALDGIHAPDHTFIKIRRPVLNAGRKRNGRLVPLLKRNLYMEESDGPSFPPTDDDAHKKQKRKLQKEEEKQKRRDEKRMRREEKCSERAMKRKAEHGTDGCCPLQQASRNETSTTPQRASCSDLGAQFVRDETIPDGAHVQPGTRLTKRWILLNTGKQTWDDNTKLTMICGTIEAVNIQVPAPHLHGNVAGAVTVELIAPQDPGAYQSHWRLMHHGICFGHRIWCSIVVDPKEVLCSPPEGASGVTIDLTMLHIGADDDNNNDCDVTPDANIVTSVSGVTKLVTDGDCDGDEAIDPDTLTDLLSFEMLNIRHLPKTSQTATPNNTPLDVSPPKSPAPELETSRLSDGSSVELVDDQLDVTDADITNTTLMTELVQSRMASLELKPSCRADIDTLSDSSSDAASGDSDSEFIIVPIPDCFDPGLPASKNASRSVCVMKESSQDKKSIDDMLTTSSDLPTEPLLPDATSSTISLVSASDTNDDDDDIDHQGELQDSGVDEAVDDNKVASAESKSNPTAPPTLVTSIDTSSNTGEVQTLSASASAVVEQMVVPPDGASEDAEPVDVNANLQSSDSDAETGEKQPVGDTESDDSDSDSLSDTEDDDATKQDAKSVDTRAVLVTALGVAMGAASSVYGTAKDVFQTLHMKSQYVPPRSTWTPPTNEWTPPNREWTPPTRDFVPPRSTWIPMPDIPAKSPPVPTPPSVPVSTPATPMDQLIEMGFANRDLNRSLLEKHDYNVHKVVQELITAAADNNWADTRH